MTGKLEDGAGGFGPGRRPTRTELAGLFRWQPIGDGTAVVCDGCNGAIKQGEKARFYAGNMNHAPQTYRIHRVYHPDCDGIDITTAEGPGGRLETPEDDVQGIGRVLYEPDLPDERPDPDELEDALGHFFEQSVKVHQMGGRPRHRLAHAVVTARQHPGADTVEMWDETVPTLDGASEVRVPSEVDDE